MPIPRFHHTETTGPSEDGFRRGLHKALLLATNSGAKQVLLTTHSLSNLQGVIKEVLGEKVFKSFVKKRILLVEGITVYLETERTKSAFARGVVLAPFVSTELLAKLQSDYRATDIVYVPWAPEELEAHKTNHIESVAI
jgi:hypothetical protein